MVDRDRVLLYTPARGRQPVIQVGIGRGGQRRGNRGLEAGAGLGERLTDTDGEGFAVRNVTVAQAGRERVFELPLQEALLDDGLEREGEVLDAHVGPLNMEVWVWRSRG